MHQLFSCSACRSHTTTTPKLVSILNELKGGGDNVLLDWMYHYYNEWKGYQTHLSKAINNSL